MWESTRVLLFPLLILLSLVPPTRAAQIPDLIGIVKADTVWSYFGGMSIVPAGDQNGDGFADFWSYDLRASAFLFFGASTNLSSQPALRLNNVNPPGANIGDMNLDGIDDFAWTTWKPFDSNKVQIFYGGMSIDTIRDRYYGRTTGIYDDLRIPSNKAILVDITGDDSPELITWSNDASHVLIYFTGISEDTVEDIVLRAYDSQFPFASFGWGRASIDLNGDQYPDLIVSHNPPGQNLVEGQLWCYYGGPGFDTLRDIRFTQPGDWAPGHDAFGRVMFNAGDMNGDGYDDLYVACGNSEDSLSFIYFGGALFDTLADVTMPIDALVGAPAGDVNNDGYADVVTGFALGSSSSDYVNVFFGGHVVDSIPDIRIFAGDLPEFNLEFGRAVAGLGDVNGDGIDDFAAGAYNDFGIGRIYVFAGKSSGSGVRQRHETLLPTTINLQQNYPNPFNPSTTIAFDIPSKANVSLIVMNILGETVRTLINRPMVAGSYEVDWDGTDDLGRLVSSGVYFYRLKTDNETRTRKMMLIK